MYSKIDSRFWDDEKVIALSNESRYLMLYLLTSKHRNMLGCYPLPKPYAQADTGLPMGVFEAAWDELIDGKLIVYDESARVVLVRNFLKYNAIENPNQAKGVLSRLEEMPRTCLFAELIPVLEKLNKAFLEPLIEGLRERLPKGFRKPDNSKQITEIITTTPDRACAREGSERNYVRGEISNSERALDMSSLPNVIPFEQAEKAEDLSPEFRDKDFILLQNKYEKRINHGKGIDTSTMLKLAELCDLLPAAALLEVVDEAAETAKSGESCYRHFETIAYSWSKNGISSVKEAREHRAGQRAERSLHMPQKNAGACEIADSLTRLYVDEEDSENADTMAFLGFGEVTN